MTRKMERLVRSVIPTPSRVTVRYRINWVVIYLITFLTGLSLLIQAPSLHQFITSSKTTSNDVEPGLGLSETWYSVIVSGASVGTFVGALVSGLTVKFIYIKAGLILELLILLSSGLLYSFSNEGWLILISRFMTGFYAGIHMSIVRVYVFETSEKLIQLLPTEKQAKSTIKYTAAFAMFMHGVFGTVFGLVVVAIAAQIPGISEFHWPGYYLTGHSLVLLVLVVLLFNERWTDVTRESHDNENKLSLKSKLLKELKDPSIPHYLSAGLTYLFFMFGWVFSIIETLQNPILSDQFGLTVKTTSYVFIGISFMNPISVVTMYICQKFYIDNRNILIGSFICGLAGSVILADWQSLGGDPCYNNYNDVMSQEASGDYSDTCNSTMDCFWNPVSRITGEYCERCRDVCLSKSHSLHFAQLIIGLLLITSTLTPGRILVTTIASDMVKNRAQPAFLFGVFVAAADIARTTGSLWANPAYLGVNHRTWLPMMILGGLLTTGLCLIAVFYRKMKRKTAALQPSRVNEEYMSSNNNEDAVELLSETDL